MLLVATFYGLYTLVRNVRGDQPVSVERATNNAHRVIRFERYLGMFHEADIQHWFIHYRWLIRLSDDYYGTVHFIAVVAVLLLLFFRFPQRYRLWRNTLALTTGLALIGFSFFPLLPPRLLPPGYHFVDTLKQVGGLWNFSSGPVNDLSNQYAAMPSLHTGWSAWCTLAVIPLVRPLWGKVLLVLYPLATIFCIIVTANHYFADVAAGLLLLGFSYLVSLALTHRVDRWWNTRRTVAAPAPTALSPTGRP